MQTRRTFLAAMSTLIGASNLELFATPRNYPVFKQREIACNQYPWFTFYKREGLEWTKDLDYSLNEFKRSGIKGYEPLINNVEEITKLSPLLDKYELQMHSIYVNSVLHLKEQAAKSIAQVLSIADACIALGVKIIVTNPSPIGWGSPEDKNDLQLQIQAENLNILGEKLQRKGLHLAYHNHDSEMRQSAREFHHMMLQTDAANVKLCLDTHWIYRGSGNSQVALFDIVKLYGSRIIELHLRQSLKGIWTETFFEEGDIDYKRLVSELIRLKIYPHIVLEQCVEEQSTKLLKAVAAHQESLKNTFQLFSPLLK